MNTHSIYPRAELKRTLEEWENLAQQGKADLAALTRDEVEHCRGFCWTCVKRWCPWNETPPLHPSRLAILKS